MDACKLPLTIVVVDDDSDDRELIREAFVRTCKCLDLVLKQDGLELMEYLETRGTSAPCLIVLDLNMPRMTGIEALQRIRSDSDLLNIPVIIFTTTDEDATVMKSYCTGATSFIKKPVTWGELLLVIDMVARYWCEVVKLPCRMGCNDLDSPKTAA